MKRDLVRIALSLTALVVLFASIPLMVLAYAGDAANWLFWRVSNFGQRLIRTGEIYGRNR